MTRHLLNILTLMMLGVATLSAQDAANTHSQRPKRPVKGRDATRFVKQDGVVPVDEPFSNRRFFDNMFFYGGLGFENYGNAGSMCSTGLGGYVGIGKYLNRDHSLRLQFDFLTHERAAGDPVKRMGGSLAHLFNISSTVFGYDPNRRVEFSTILGGGIQRAEAKNEDEAVVGWRVFTGIQLKYHMSRNFDLSLEPIVAISDTKLAMIESVRKPYLFSYGASLNMRYIVNNPAFRFKSRNGTLVYGNFFTASVGAQWHLSGMPGSEPGPTATIGVGRWIMPGMGVKLSGTMGHNTWHKAEYSAEFLETEKPYQCYENTSYMGGRLELVFNPFVFFRKIDEESRYLLRILGGGEFGYMSKYNYNKPIHSAYQGYTAALQLGLRWDDDKLLYLEPRFSALTYSMPYEKINIYHSFTDNIVSLSLGLEIDQSIVPRRNVNRRLRSMFSKSRRLEVGVEAGASMLLHSRMYHNVGASFQVGTLVQYWLSPINGIALHAGVNRTADDEPERDNKFTLVNTSLQYRFDFTNWMQGYDPHRKLSLQLFAGPAVGVRIWRAMEEDGTMESQFRSNAYFGAEAGFSGRLNLIKERLGLYVAPQINLYPNGMLISDQRGWRKIFSVSMGVTYKI